MHEESIKDIRELAKEHLSGHNWEITFCNVQIPYIPAIYIYYSCRNIDMYIKIFSIIFYESNTDIAVLGTAISKKLK